MSLDIRGTGNCFNEAAEMLEMLIKVNNLDPRCLTVCHGICLLEENDVPYSHAWIEIGENVFQFGIDQSNGTRRVFQAPKLVQYRRSRARDVTRYSVDRFRKLIRKNGHAGPWEPRYVALTITKEEHERKWGKPSFDIKLGPSTAQSRLPDQIFDGLI